MKDRAKRIAIIPARGGSVRILNKNIKEFCGKPIISYSLETAKNTGLFDVIHVSTDSERIASVCKELGYPVDFMRPKELADHKTPILPVLQYAINSYLEQGNKFDELCLILPCAPLLESGDLCFAAELYKKYRGERSVLSISKYPSPIERAFDFEKDGTLKPVFPGKFSVCSNDLKARYYDAGAFDYMSTRRMQFHSVDEFTDSYVGYVLPPERAVDIDEPEDWTMAEKLYRIKYPS